MGEFWAFCVRDATTLVRFRFQCSTRLRAGRRTSAIVLAWALAPPAVNCAAVLAAAHTGGITRVTFDGRTMEYRSLDELGRALSALHAAENSAVRRPGVTFASFSS